MEPAATDLEVIVEDVDADPPAPALTQDEEIHLSLLGSPTYSLPRGFFEPRAHALPPEARRAAERGERLLLFPYQLEHMLAEAEPDTAWADSRDVWLEVAEALASFSRGARRGCGILGPGIAFSALIQNLDHDIRRLAVRGEWHRWAVDIPRLIDALFSHDLRVVRRLAADLVALAGEAAALVMAQQVQAATLEAIAAFRRA